jgi:outer membrane protein OmpA-like peptidoglycan-associated protein
MKKFIALVFPCVMAVCLASCAGSKPITYTNASFTEKDEVMITNNTSYVTASVVGNGGNLANAEKKNLLRKKLSDREQKLKGINGVQIRTIESENGNEFVATVNNDILFAHNSFDLTPQAMTILSELATIINDIPGTKVQVIGYTDSTGTVDYNMKLSQLRANSVAIHLHELGITDITELAKGVENPVASNETEDGRKKNRRVEIKLSPQNS